MFLMEEAALLDGTLSLSLPVAMTSVPPLVRALIFGRRRRPKS